MDPQKLAYNLSSRCTSSGKPRRHRTVHEPAGPTRGSGLTIIHSAAYNEPGDFRRRVSLPILLIADFTAP